MIALHRVLGFAWGLLIYSMVVDDGFQRALPWIIIFLVLTAFAQWQHSQ